MCMHTHTYDTCMHMRMQVSAVFSRQGLIALVKLNVESLAHSQV